MIVRARAEVRTLGNGHSAANRDGAQVIHQRMLADRAPVADRQVPWEVNYGRLVDVDATPDVRTKQPQQPPPPAEGDARAETEQQLAPTPEHATNELRARIFASRAVLCDVEVAHPSTTVDGTAPPKSTHAYTSRICRAMDGHDRCSRTYVAPRSPIACLCSGLMLIASRSAASIASTEISVHQPHCRSLSTDHGAPFVVITGSPAAMASATTMPKFSLCVGNTNRSDSA